MGIAGRRVSVAASLVVGLAAGLAGGRAYAQDASKIHQLYEEGVKALESQNYEAALAKFKAMFQEDPSQAQVIDLIRTTESKHFWRMMSKGGEYEMAAKRLLSLGHQGMVERSRDPEAIRPLVDKAVGAPDLLDRRAATRELASKHGQFAVPFLVKYLGSNDTDERVHAIMVLESIGIEAVLPLVEVLHSPDALVRQNAVVVLRRLVDPRAYPILNYLAQSKDQPEQVRAAASAAVASLADVAGVKGMKPEEAFLQVARGYYRKAPEVLRDLGGTYTLWKWEEGQLKSQDVPRLMYHLRLAEKACDMAVAANPDSAQARGLLAIIYAGQQVALANAGQEFRDSEAGKAETARLAMADAAIRSQGAPILLAALGLSLEWGDTEVATAILRTLPTFSGQVSLDGKSNLVAALGAPDQVIQREAALCVIRLQPKAAFPRCDLVVPLAADAVSLGSVRQVLIVEPDTKVAVQLQTELNAAGLNAVVARDGAEGLVRSKQVSFDAVLVSNSLKDIMAQQVVNDIRRDARTRGLPVLVVAPEAQAEALKSLYGASISGVVTLPAAASVYVANVKAAAETSPLDDRARALAMSDHACEVLAGAAAAPCFDFSRAQKALVGVLSTDKPDGTKLKALAALRRWGGADSLAGLLACVANSAQSEAVRAEAGSVAGTLLAGKAPTAKGFEILVAGLSDASIAVRTACAGALGGASLGKEQRAIVSAKTRL
jgi:HEAT repeat protein